MNRTNTLLSIFLAMLFAFVNVNVSVGKDVSINLLPTFLGYLILLVIYSRLEMTSARSRSWVRVSAAFSVVMFVLSFFHEKLPGGNGTYTVLRIVLMLVCWYLWYDVVKQVGAILLKVGIEEMQKLSYVLEGISLMYIIQIFRLFLTEKFVLVLLGGFYLVSLMYALISFEQIIKSYRKTMKQRKVQEAHTHS